MRANPSRVYTDAAGVDSPPEDQLIDLPTDCANALARGGYGTRAAVAAASDEELVRLRGIGPRRLAVIRAAIPTGAPTPVGPPLPRATAAAARREHRSRRDERERAIRGAIIACLRAGGVQTRAAIHRHLVEALGSCAEMTFRSRLRALLQSGDVEAIVDRSPGRADPHGRVLFALPPCPRPDARA
jgi:hypothetical protein